VISEGLNFSRGGLQCSVPVLCIIAARVLMPCGNRGRSIGKHLAEFLIIKFHRHQVASTSQTKISNLGYQRPSENKDPNILKLSQIPRIPRVYRKQPYQSRTVDFVNVTRFQLVANNRLDLCEQCSVCSP